MDNEDIYKFINEYLKWLTDEGIVTSTELSIHRFMMLISLKGNPFETLEKLVETNSDLALPAIELLGKYNKL